MLNKFRSNQSGAASMIVVIFVAIILSIVTIGFIRLSINEQRESTDLDLSQRAYYAAESGLEDARRAVGEYLQGTLTNLEGDNCSLPSGYSGVLSNDPDFDIEYTCMFVDLTPAEYRASFDSANQTKSLRILPINANNGNPANFGSLTLQWHVNNVSPAGDGLLSGSGGLVSLRGAGATDIPQRTSWSSPAMLEIQFIAYPDGTGANRIQPGSVANSVSYVSPNSGGSGSSGGNVFSGGAPPLTTNGVIDAQVLTGDCNPGAAIDDYVCTMTFNFGGFPINSELEMRITNRYAPTTLEMTMSSAINGGGQPRLFDEAQATVDVTGRAGTVYRRAEASLDLTGQDLLPDFTIQSASDICKDFSFTDQLPDFGGITGTSCRR